MAEGALVACYDEAETDSDLIFRAEFSSCHVIRQLLEYLNPTMTVLPIYFSAKEIKMLCANETKTLFFHGIIGTHNLTDYYLHPSFKRDLPNEIDKEGNEVEVPDEEHVVQVEVSKLLKSIKDLPRKGTFVISQYFSQPDDIALTVFDTQSMQNFVRVLSSRIDDVEFGERNPLPSNKPNKTILLSKFAHIAGAAAKSSARNSYIRCYPTGMDIVGTSSDKIIASHVGWGDYEDENKRICEIKVGVNIMKSMAKLSNLCSEGIIRVYCNDPSYMRLEIPISVLGEAYIYITSGSSSD